MYEEKENVCIPQKNDTDLEQHDCEQIINFRVNCNSDI